MPPDIQIRILEISKQFGVDTAAVLALRGVTFDICRGEFVSIIGPSGSGKSTLMYILGCLDRPSSGKYLFDGADIACVPVDDLASLRNTKIGFVFQQFNLLPRYDAVGNVQLPLCITGIPRADRIERAKMALDRVGLASRVTHRPNELSGGECQRVAIARALINNPSVILADEPTGNLDSRTGEGIVSLFYELNAMGHTIIIVTHDLGLAKRTPRQIVLKDGVLVLDTGGPGIP